MVGRAFPAAGSGGGGPEEEILGRGGGLRDGDGRKRMNGKSHEAHGARMAGGPGRTVKAAPRRLQSRELLADAQEVIIEHEGDDYRLRCTSKGKLILTK